jgi:hypothetical protein
MIRYALRCEEGHEFETWFENSAAFDKQAARKLVTCPHCNSAKVEKAIMAPRLTRHRHPPSAPADATPTAATVPTANTPTMAAPGANDGVPAPVAMVSPQEQELRSKLKELRDHIVKNADYVGRNFPEEARKIHYGETERRSIFGEASPEDAKELHEEGIEFHALPVLPEDRN